MSKTIYKHEPQLVLLVGAWHLLKQTMGFGNPTAGGFSTMAEALRGVAEMNKKLNGEHGYKFAVSGHLFHEIVVPGDAPDIGYSAKWNNPRSVELDEWVEKSKSGEFAPVGRLIPPGFGLPGSDDGAFIHPDVERRKLAHDIMVYCFLKSVEVQVVKCNLGHVIYWTGPDGIRWKRMVEGNDVRLGYKKNPRLDEWKLIVSGVGNAVRDALQRGCKDVRLLIEGKAAGDPCYLDVFTDAVLEVMGINAINKVAGEIVAEWQGEFCHERGAGLKFKNAMEAAIKGKVFGGAIHLNSGGLASVNFSELLAKKNGTRMSLFQQYVDNDFLPGEGVREWVEDQEKSICVGTRWSAMTGKPFEVEFDARFCRYPDTIDKLWKSAEWTINRFNTEMDAIASN